MDEDAAIIESILREEAFLNGEVIHDSDSGWTTVAYSKRHNPAKYTPEYIRANGASVVTVGGENSDVFSSIDKQAEERRRRVVEAQKAALEAHGVVGSDLGLRDQGHSVDGDDRRETIDDCIVAGGDNAGVQVEKPKEKKVMKHKITVAEAADKIDAGDFGAYLIDISSSYESQQDIQLMRFVDYFARAFAPVAPSQFPWAKMLQESSVAKMVDIPLADLPELIYKTSMDWLNERSIDAVEAFVLWSWESILGYSYHTGTAKNGKKQIQPTEATLKYPVAMFMVLSMALRRKPDALISLLPKLKDNPKYVEQDKLPIMVWVIAQACQGDLVIGLYFWVRILLPMLNGKSGCSPQSRDMILQVVERIISSTPKACSILLNGAVKKGERLVPPSAFEDLMRQTFSTSSAQSKGRERLNTVYPILKEVALAGNIGSKGMKQVLQQTLTFCIKVAAEGNPDLSNEAINVIIWCLERNPDCCKQWDSFYLENVESSLFVLRKMSKNWKISAKSSELGHLVKTISNMRLKNKRALASKEYVSIQPTLKEADKHCRIILSRLARGNGCLKGTIIVSAAMVVAAVILSQTLQPEELEQLFEKLTNLV